MRCLQGEARLRRSADDREDPVEARAFELHLLDCAACANDQEALDRARQELQATPIEPSAQALNRMRQHIRDTTREERALGRPSARPVVLAWVGAVGAGLGVAVLIGVLVVRFSRAGEPPESRTVDRGLWQPGDQLPVGRPVSIPAPTFVQLGPARLAIGAGTKVIFEAQGVDLQIVEGEVHLAYDFASAGQTFVVQTPTARISTFGCALHAEVDARGARISVERGTAEVEPATSGGRRTSLPAGSQVYVRADLATERRPIGAPSVVEPAQAQTQRPTPASIVQRRLTPTTISSGAARETEEAPLPSSAGAPAGAVPITANSPPDLAVAGHHRDTAISDQLASARSILTLDAARARKIAEAAIELKPSPTLEAEALMLSADACRRSGAKRAAIEYYLRVAEHVAGAPFAEEALLRAARLEVADGDPSHALERLEVAALRFPAGPLLPERTALATALLRGVGRIREAAARLEAVPLDNASLALGRERLATAEALLPLYPERAEALVLPLTSQDAARELWRPALELRLKVAELRGDRGTSDRLRKRLQDLGKDVKD